MASKMKYTWSLLASKFKKVEKMDETELWVV